MKHVPTLALIVLVIASTAFAQLPPKGYIGLFTDANHDTWCVTGAMPFYMADVWIFCLPSVDGMLCAEFAISYPSSGIIQSAVTPNVAIISVALGDLPNGMSVCYIECQWDWHWCFHQQIFVNAPDQTMLELIPHTAPQITVLQFAECIPPKYPMEAVIKFTNFYINYDPITEPLCQVAGAESKSWGAIKTMIAE